MRDEIFENVRLYETPESRKKGRLVLKYVCSECGKLIDHSKFFETPVDKDGNQEWHQTRFWCEECWQNRVIP